MIKSIRNVSLVALGAIGLWRPTAIRASGPDCGYVSGNGWDWCTDPPGGGCGNFIQSCCGGDVDGAGCGYYYLNGGLQLPCNESYGLGVYCTPQA